MLLLYYYTRIYNYSNELTLTISLIDRTCDQLNFFNEIFVCVALFLFEDYLYEEICIALSPLISNI